MSVVGVVSWFVAAASCVVAAFGLLRGHTFWVGAGYLSQGLVLGLALYIIFADIRSPVPQWKWGVTAVGATAALIAGLWLWELRKYRALMRFNRIPPLAGITAAVVATAFALFQGWYQADYLPRSAWPHVDLTTELVETGRTGPIAHFSAKITIENKGAVEAQSIGSVMRVVGYRTGAPNAAPPTPAQLAKVVDLGQAADDEYRAIGADNNNRELLYANDFTTFHSILTPGVKVSYQYEVDVDTRQFRVARLTATVIAFSGRRLAGKVDPCGSDQVKLLGPNPTLEQIVTTPIKPFGYDEICFDSEIPPRNVIDKLVSDRPWVRYHMVVSPPSFRPDAELPFIYLEWVTADSPTEWPTRTGKEAAKLDALYPRIVLPSSSEVAITAPEPPDGGSPKPQPSGVPQTQPSGQ